MTSMYTATENAAPASEIAALVNGPKPSRKRLKTLTDADKMPATSSPPPATNRKERHTASANGSAAGDASDALAQLPRQTKASIVEALLTREGGASLKSLCETTGWQAHTCRAFLTGLRKKGREVIRASDRDGKSIYLIATDRLPAASPDPGQAEAERN